MERALADLGMTSPQFVVLTMFEASPGLSGADLARVALQTPQTVGVIIRNLERDGAIRKSPHPIHGRVLQWTVTRGVRPCSSSAGGAPMRSSGGWGRALHQGTGHDPPLARQNRRGFVGIAGSRGVMAFDAVCRAARLAG